MISLKYGNAQTSMVLGIGVGLGIGVILALIIIFALFKTNSFEKFSFFKNKMDEEERLLQQERSSR